MLELDLTKDMASMLTMARRTCWLAGPPAASRHGRWRSLNGWFFGGWWQAQAGPHMPNPLPRHSTPACYHPVSFILNRTCSHQLGPVHTYTTDSGFRASRPSSSSSSSSRALTFSVFFGPLQLGYSISFCV